ncbi:MAG: site-specific DNA-methyltransferase [Myxococcota bacterium]|nr:site-specific DNA-methyltransferase [Myxococcota bacterium]
MAENQIIFGDNLEVMTDLAATASGRFQLAYLDPPYNTGGTPEDYDDQREPDQWIRFMRERLQALRPLMAPDGVVFVQIDDREQAHLKVLMDEILGRERCLAHVVIKMSELSGVKMSHADQRLPKVKEHLLIYGMGSGSQLRNLRRRKAPEVLANYLNYYRTIIDNPEDSPDQWCLLSIKTWARESGLLDGVRTGSKNETQRLQELKLEEAHRVVYRTNNRLLAEQNLPGISEVISPNGRRYISWQGKQMLFLKDHIDEPLSDLWTDLSTINLNKEGAGSFRFSKKPEALLHRCLELASKPGDWIIDPFCGSGTTAAVAHKMGRSWVTIDCEEHLLVQAKPRLDAVVAGQDAGGITRLVGWQGGGRFQFVHHPASGGGEAVIGAVPQN